MPKQKLRFLAIFTLAYSCSTTGMWSKVCHYSQMLYYSLWRLSAVKSRLHSHYSGSYYVFYVWLAACTQSIIWQQLICSALLTNNLVELERVWLCETNKQPIQHGTHHWAWLKVKVYLASAIRGFCVYRNEYSSHNQENDYNRERLETREQIHCGYMQCW